METRFEILEGHCPFSQIRINIIDQHRLGKLFGVKVFGVCMGLHGSAEQTSNDPTTSLYSYSGLLCNLR